MAKEEETPISFIKRLKRISIVLIVLVLIGLIGYVLILFGGRLVADKDELVLDATTTIETVDGKVIATLYNENRSLVSLDQVPTHVQDSFIAIEDVRFYKHKGLDFKSIVRAVFKDIVAREKVEGASTLTQQLAKNLFLESDKTWTRKTKEAMAALYLERKFTKDEIFELYLNTIYFGEGVYGIEMAARYFYSKPVEELSVAEGALLAGLAKAPNGYSPINNPEKALQRRNVVLKVMGRENMISTEKQLSEQGRTLGLDLLERETNPWVDGYVDLVTKEAVKEYQLSMEELKRGGYRIVINIDEIAQKIAYEEFKNNAYFPGNSEEAEGAFVLMSQESGEVKVAIGGRDFGVGELNRVTVERQPGSLMKPLAVFGPAMMKEEYHPYSLIRDEKIDLDGYTASNFDDQYEGAVSIYQALTESKNTPAVWLLDEIGINYSKKYLKKMEMDIPDKGLAIALGGLSEGVTPIDIVGGYRTFAHLGEYIQPQTIKEIYDQEDERIEQAEPVSEQVFKPQVAWDMTEILANVIQEGTGQAGDYSKALAGKTGSTEHPHVKGMYKDAWFAGFTPDYVSALWMGYDQSDEEHYLTEGSSYPTALTKAILTKIDEQESLTAEFTKPKNVKPVPKPIELPIVSDVRVKYIMGGFPFIKGKITWTAAEDERVEYHIYHVRKGQDKQIGEVTGQGEFVIDRVSLLTTNEYYIVPYDPLTEMEGEHSETVELTF